MGPEASDSPRQGFPDSKKKNLQRVIWDQLGSTRAPTEMELELQTTPELEGGPETKKRGVNDPRA